MHMTKDKRKRRSLALLLALCMILTAGGILSGAADGQGIRGGMTDLAADYEPLQVEAAASEYRAFWYSYYDYESWRSGTSKRNASTFAAYFNKVCKNGKNRGMNRVIVQVRPFADAMYNSKYFPWSACISGTQGKSPGFDPLKIMVNAAHKNGLKIEAWVNPYRVAAHSNYSRLSKDNIARIWHNTTGKKRNTLVYNGMIYFNPAKAEVRTLITNGIVEIVKGYAVDGVHMDDYFYPSFSSSNVKTAFDASEYKNSDYYKQGKTIASFRRHQVNLLVRKIRSAVKSARSSCTFGISPAGNIDNLTSPYAYYVDIGTWLKSKEYIDYICPQVYWGFKHPTAKFNSVVNRWIKKNSAGKVKLYVGIAVYKAGHSVGASAKERKEWKSDTNVLKKMVTYSRGKGIKGFAFFDYCDLVSSTSAKAVKKLKTVLK